MNFTEIVAEVVRVTKRPDKILDARREVNAAINFYSIDSFFDRDISEITLPISVGEYTQDIPFSDLPRFRKFQYIKRAGTLNYLSTLDKVKLFIRGCDIVDKYYITGPAVRISMKATAAALDIGYWQYPPILTDAAPEFWQLEGNWPAVLDRAMAKVFANIGDDASSAKHERYAVVAYLAFRATLQNQS
jgi:hypothetical protein